MRLPRRFVARALRLSEYRNPVLNAPVDEPRRLRARADLSRVFDGAGQAAFEHYAQLTGVDEAKVLAALAVDFVDPAILGDEPWARLLCEVLSGAFLARCDTNITGCQGIRAPLYPFVNWAKTRIEGWRSTYDCEWSTLGDALLGQFAALLAGAAFKALILESNIHELKASPADDADGLTASGRFAREVRRHRRLVQRFFLTYAALSRLLAVMTLQWVKNTEALLRRLDLDLSDIRSTILHDDPGALRYIAGTLSDSHDGGQGVLILEFTSGDKLVYKPRNIDIDVSYQALLGALNDAGLRPFMRQLAIVARPEYGWIEFVTNEPLPSLEASHDFYIRNGINLAITFITKATDFHYENIIAAGEHPILIDLETLMHGDPSYWDKEYDYSPAESALMDSVFTSGLLPGWTKADAEEASPDMSGLGAREGQFYRGKTEVVERSEEGTIRIARRRVPLPENDNRPVWRGERLNPSQYSDDLVEGFRRAYEVVTANAGSLLSPDGTLTAMSRCQVRHVALNTMTYSSLQRRAMHPDFLQRSVHRELILANLAYRSLSLPGAAALLKSELSALFNGDIPKFVTVGDETSLFDEQGTPIPNFLLRSGKDEIAARVMSLSPENLEFQSRIIRLAMLTVVKPGEPGSEMHPPLEAPKVALDDDELLGEVRGIGHHICDLAITDAHNRSDWIGLCDADLGGASISAVGSDIYDGAAGIGVFLSAAGRRLGDDRLLTIARRCGLIAKAALHNPILPVGGGFTGRVSSAYGLLRMAVLLDEPSWIGEASDALEGFALAAKTGKVLDVLSGTAGLVGVLAAAYRLTSDKALLSAIVQPAEHLLARRIKCEVGAAWAENSGAAPLTGFSHGAAGMGWAMLHAGDLTGREDFISAGYDAFDYEESLYSDAGHGWPDLRENRGDWSGPARDTAVWCHGAPGIGLSRATLPLKYRRETEVLSMERAVYLQTRARLAQTDCLCHGELGNLDMIIEVAGALGDTDLDDLARRRASGAVQRKRSVGSWRCGAIPNVTIPGFMTGLAGIGYGLLRAQDPQATPSVLSLG